MDVLSRDGLAYFWGKCKSAFAAKSHAHDAGAITSGTIDDARIPTTVARESDIASLRDSVSQTAAKVPGHVYAGTKIITSSGGDARLFTADEFKSVFGREFSASTDYIGVMNADGTANGSYLTTAYYSSASRNLWVNGGNDGALRVNYLVFLAD